MNDKIHHPHDKRYKMLLSREQIFIDFVQHCVGGAWSEELAVDKLTKIDKEHIDDNFIRLESDLIYKVELEKQDFYYILLEHQSEVDSTMPFRLLRYMVGIWNSYYNRDKNKQDFKLPAIIPIVVSNSPNAWSPPITFKEIITGYQDYGDLMVDFRYIVVDINQYTETDLQRFTALLSLVFYLEKVRLLKSSITEQLIARSDDLVSLKEYERKALIEFVEIITTGEISEDARKQLINYIKDPKEVDNLGIFEENMAKDREELIEKGRLEGKLEAARELLSRGMNYKDIQDILKLNDDQLEVLKH